MKTVGIICEYNPFHLGHKKQFDIIRQTFGPETAIVCLMSGNFVQRGAPAIFDKSFRARAAIDSGADLVLELPVTYALSSAEGFAAGGVRILSGVCDTLCFGTENGSKDSLLSTAASLLSPDFSEKLRIELDKGLSFPAARAAALGDDSLLRNPNDILAVEYCKAILAQDSPMDIFPIHREGSYHADTPDAENPSATSLRSRIAEGAPWLSYIPASAHPAFENAATHTLAAGERAILARLRTMTDADFEALPYGSEGLWRKLMHACRDSATLEEIIAKTKSKRYTRTRIDRMIMCAFLGITSDRLASPAPYARVLGFTDAGRTLLKKARETGLFPHTGDTVDDAYQALETRCDDLYGLFAHEPEPAGITAKRRVYIKKSTCELQFDNLNLNLSN